MRYTRIELIGDAGNFAVLTRHPKGSPHIEVEVITPGGNKKHAVIADDRDDKWSMAECLQENLDGRKGCGGDIRDYFNALELLAEQ